MAAAGSAERRVGWGVAILLVALAVGMPAAAQTPATPPVGAAPPPGAPTPRAPAQGAATVAVRGADHPGYSRVVFDWPGSLPVGYSLRRDGAAVTVLFDRPGTLALARGVERLRNITRIEGFKQPAGTLGITFVAPLDGDVRDFRNGSSVVLDVGNPGTRKSGADAVPEKPPEKPAERAPEKAAEKPPEKAAAKPPEKAAEKPGTAVAAPAASGAAAAQPAAGKATAVPPQAAAKGTTPVAGAAPGSAAPPTAPAANSEPPAVVFDAGGPASLAVFPRAGYLYAVFDRALPIGAGRVQGVNAAETLGAVEPVPATGGSAFRTRVGPLVWPKVERQGTVWRISPSSRLANPVQDLQVVPDPEFLLGARLLVRTADAATVVQLADPEVGDRILAIPLPVAGQAVTAGQRFPDVELLPSMQGVAVRPIADDVTVRPAKEGIEISAAGGLNLSPVADTGLTPAVLAQAAAAARGSGQPDAGKPAAAGSAQRPPQGRRLFDLEAWQRGGLPSYNDSRQELQLAAAEAPDDVRPRAQLDLAKFYLAQGFGQEALGVLDVILTNQPDLEGWPEFRALRGAARALAGDLDGAAQDLSHPSIAGNPEAGVWRAAVDAQRGQWAQAADGFRAGAGILSGYPEPVLSRLSLLAAEAALRSGDTATAQRLVDRIAARAGEEAAERNDLQYLRGELARLGGDADRAIEYLKAAYDGLDRYYRAKAGLALTDVQLAEHKISPAAAAERLWGLTFTWRGDDLETDIRQRLGQAQIAAGNYAEGFNTLKDTAALVGDTPKAEQITRDMRRSFADLFHDGAAKIPTLDALKLYDGFRELTPVGEEGDALIRTLAERLVDIDFLGRAADLYQHQVEYRLSGMDKARIGTRLASIRLLDGKPAEAIQALELSNVPGIPPDLAAERRTMQAKALAELGRGDQALQLLAQDDSRPADLLRVDIAWREQKWDQAASALGKVIGPPPAAGTPLAPAVSSLVLNRAVALALAGDGTGLNGLRKDFGTAMASGPDADAFRVLTRPEQATGLIDVNTIRSRVAEVDVFKSFLKGYRDRRPATPGSPSAALTN